VTAGLTYLAAVVILFARPAGAKGAEPVEAPRASDVKPVTSAT